MVNLLHEFNTSLDILQEFRDGSLEELLFELVELAVAEVLGHTVLAEENRVSEVACFCQVRLDVRAFYYIGFSLEMERWRTI